jgi:hypothetical protein
MSGGAYYHYVLLGRPFTLNTFGCNLSDADEAEVQTRVTAAIALLNLHGSQLPEGVLDAIRQIDSIITPPANSDKLGSQQNFMTISLAYMRAVSPEWFTSIWAHEGQHILNRGKYHGADLWRDEQSAVQTQVACGKVIGMAQDLIDGFEKGSADDQAANLQIHMTQGYSGPP